MTTYKFLCEFYVNNVRTKEEVQAQNLFDAKRLIEARYSGAKVRWAQTPRKIQ